MSAETSPVSDFQHRRRLSIDAEDELFKSLQGVQERNNSERQQRSTIIGSPSGNQRIRRRGSLDLNEGRRATMLYSRNPKTRKERRADSLDIHCVLKRRSGGSNSNRRERHPI